MNCPFCNSTDLKVIDKRSSIENSIRRRRQCVKCGKRFTTHERIERLVLLVQKRDGTTEYFDKDKIKVGILKAVKKRNIPESVIDDIVHDIEQQLINSDKQIVRSVDIGEMVLTRLADIDKLGALLFAAVYREFKTLEDVETELRRLSSKFKGSTS